MPARNLAQWLAWQESLHPAVMELGLERCLAVKARMGWPEPEFPILTVGGTNGKGSSVAFLEAMLEAAGYRTGAYTSPHLLRYNERVRVAGRAVDDAALCAAFERVEAARGQVSLTYFEFGTLAAMEVFQRAQTDVVILEVGLGGRLDAVNVFDADAALVTSVQLDHMEWLGPDREAIGFEKAGIYRAGRPAIYGEPDPPVSLVQRVHALGAPWYCAGAHFRSRGADPGWYWEGPRGARLGPLPEPALAGDYQRRNAAAVLMMLQVLRDRLPVSPGAMRAGLLAARVPGRLQVVPGAVERILDVAHNPHAVRALSRYLESRRPAGRTLGVIGMLRDKDRLGAVQAIGPSLAAWFVGGLEECARGAPAADLAALIRSAYPRMPVAAHPDIGTAYRAAEAEARAGDRIVVFGSFHTVAAVLPLLGARTP